MTALHHHHHRGVFVTESVTRLGLSVTDTPAAKQSRPVRCVVCVCVCQCVCVCVVSVCVCVCVVLSVSVAVHKATRRSVMLNFQSVQPGRTDAASQWLPPLCRFILLPRIWLPLSRYASNNRSLTHWSVKVMEFMSNHLLNQSKVSSTGIRRTVRLSHRTVIYKESCLACFLGAVNITEDQIDLELLKLDWCCVSNWADNTTCHCCSDPFTSPTWQVGVTTLWWTACVWLTPWTTTSGNSVTIDELWRGFVYSSQWLTAARACNQGRHRRKACNQCWGRSRSKRDSVTGDLWQCRRPAPECHFHLGMPVVSVCVRGTWRHDKSHNVECAVAWIRYMEWRTRRVWRGARKDGITVLVIAMNYLLTGVTKGLQAFAVTFTYIYIYYKCWREWALSLTQSFLV